ncbi:hypothetical protein EVAR_79189_1 [Eumeta japonica]|uniref:Uncharacterized protein n=1 Tax=Eumeta variegata TaxID=151549 RepID=A0A4C1UTU3_EUMVA|nr:hypothetical protein EVAR_79189_1 [Eumeta japonica]
MVKTIPYHQRIYGGCGGRHGPDGRLTLSRVFCKLIAGCGWRERVRTRLYLTLTIGRWKSKRFYSQNWRCSGCELMTIRTIDAGDPDRYSHPNVRRGMYR